MFAPEPHVPHIPFLLGDDTPVTLRPVVAEDLMRMREAAEMLSAESMYTRFNTGFRRLSEGFMKRLLDADQVNHIAWGCLLSSDLEFPGLGIAHMIRLPEQEKTAELAVTVIDAYQNRGLGGILLALMYLLAPKNNIELLVAELTVENEAFVEQMKLLGGASYFEDQHFSVSWPVYKDWKKFPANSTAQRFVFLLKQLSARLRLEGVEI